MTGEILFVFGLLLITIILFVSGLFRLDVVAIMVIITLILSGLLSPTAALAGFGDPVVLLIAGLFVVGEALFRTGVAYAIGDWLMRAAGTSESRLLILLMLVVAGLSAFMSSTGAVAIFIPVALNLAAKVGSNPSRLMMPLAFASLIGGMLTLIGTPPNLVVSTQLTKEGLESFGFFDFTPIGLLVLLVGIAYIMLFGRRLLPQEEGVEGVAKDRLSLLDLAQIYNVTNQLHRLRLWAGSPMEGKTVGQALLRTRYGVTVLGVERQQRRTKTVKPALIDTEFRAGDIIYAVGTDEEVDSLVKAEELERLEIGEGQGKVAAQELGLVEVLLAPRSELIGKTLSEARFRERYGLSVLAVLRQGEPLRKELVETPLAFGDSLLMGGGWTQIDLLQGKQKDFLVLNLPKEMSEVAPNRSKAPWALAVTLGMMLHDLQACGCSYRGFAGSIGHGPHRLCEHERCLQVGELGEFGTYRRNAAHGHSSGKDRRSRVNRQHPYGKLGRVWSHSFDGGFVYHHFSIQSVYFQYRYYRIGCSHCRWHCHGSGGFNLSFPDDCGPGRLDSFLNPGGIAGEYSGSWARRL